MLNCIVLPLVLMAITNGTLLGSNSVADKMLNFSITNCVLPLLLTIFDPIHFLKRLVLRIPWTRNKSNPDP